MGRTHTLSPLPMQRYKVFPIIQSISSNFGNGIVLFRKMPTFGADKQETYFKIL